MDKFEEVVGLRVSGLDRVEAEALQLEIRRLARRQGLRVVAVRVVRAKDQQAVGDEPALIEGL